MATTLRIAENNLLTTNAFVFPINPTQPRGFRKKKPVSVFPTLSGSGGIQMPKDHYPLVTFEWPAVIESQYSSLRAALEARMYAETGLEYFVGIIVGDSIDQGWPFPTTNKYVKIRTLNVESYENPIDNNIDHVIYNLRMTALWVDAP